jgi:hypothetical protein
VEGDAYDAEGEERGLARGDSTQYRSHYRSRDRCIAVVARHMTSVTAAMTTKKTPPSTAPSIRSQTPSKAISTEPTYATLVKILSKSNGVPIPIASKAAFYGEGCPYTVPGAIAEGLRAETPDTARQSCAPG